jgi:hypothetical protein
MRVSVLILSCLFVQLPSWAAAESEPIPTTLCEIVRKPKQFDGKLVKVRATVLIGLEESLVRDNGCGSEARAWAAYEDLPETPSEAMEDASMRSPGDLRRPESLQWHPVELPSRVKVKRDSEFEKLAAYAKQQFKPRPGMVCSEGCPAYSVTATFTGRLDFHDRLRAYLHQNDNGKVWVRETGFGHLGAWDERLVVESVSAVVVVKVDPAIYRSSK